MYTKEFLLDMYRTLYTTRTFEQRCIQYYRQGLIIGYFHPYIGEEAIATGVCAALGDADYIVSTHRGHGHCVARGGELRGMFAEVFGRETGYCAGRGGSMHIADVTKGNIGANGIVGGGMPLGVGAGLGIKLRKSDQVAVVFFSDGAANNGVFSESMNLAAIWDLPVLFVLENNQFAVSTPIEQSSRITDLYKRAEGYGVTASLVDGNNALEVYEAAAAAVADCRSGRGPVLIEAKTYRHGGHHVNDPGLYLPKDKLEYYQSKDPVTMHRTYMLDQAAVTEEEITGLEQDVIQQVEDAAEFARNSSEPSVQRFLEEVSCL